MLFWIKLDIFFLTIGSTYFVDLLLLEWEKRLERQQLTGYSEFVTTWLRDSWKRWQWRYVCPMKFNYGNFSECLSFELVHVLLILQVMFQIMFFLYCGDFSALEIYKCLFFLYLLWLINCIPNRVHSFYSHLGFIMLNSVRVLKFSCHLLYFITVMCVMYYIRVHDKTVNSNWS